MPTDRKIHIVVSGIVHFPFHDQAVFFENICNDQFKIKGIYFFVSSPDENKNAALSGFVQMHLKSLSLANPCPDVG